MSVLVEGRWAHPGPPDRLVPCLSINACPSIRPSVRPSVRPSIHPCVRACVRACVRSALFFGAGLQRLRMAAMAAHANILSGSLLSWKTPAILLEAIIALSGIVPLLRPLPQTMTSGVTP